MLLRTKTSKNQSKRPVGQTLLLKTDMLYHPVMTQMKNLLEMSFVYQALWPRARKPNKNQAETLKMFLLPFESQLFFSNKAYVNESPALF